MSNVLSWDGRVTLSQTIIKAVIQKQNHASQDVRPPLRHKIYPSLSQKDRHPVMSQGSRVAVLIDFHNKFLYNIYTR